MICIKNENLQRKADICGDENARRITVVIQKKAIFFDQRFISESHPSSD